MIKYKESKFVLRCEEAEKVAITSWDDVICAQIKLSCQAPH